MEETSSVHLEWFNFLGKLLIEREYIKFLGRFWNYTTLVEHVATNGVFTFHGGTASDLTYMIIFFKCKRSWISFLPHKVAQKIEYFRCLRVKLTLKTCLYWKKMLKNLPLEQNIFSFTYFQLDNQGGSHFFKIFTNWG